MLRSILMTVVLLVPFVSIVDPPPPSLPLLPEFKSVRAMTLMTPTTWQIALTVAPCQQSSTLITSSANGRHRRDSQHYQKRALDFRTKHLTKKERTRFEGCAKTVLGDSYFVKLFPHPPHLHVALLAEPH